MAGGRQQPPGAARRVGHSEGCHVRGGRQLQRPQQEQPEHAGVQGHLVREGDRAAPSGDGQGEGDDQGVAEGAPADQGGAGRCQPETGPLRTKRRHRHRVHAAPAGRGERGELALRWWGGLLGDRFFVFSGAPAVETPPAPCPL